MRVLGVDPGTHRMGVGILEADGQKYKVIHCGTIRAGSKDVIAKRLLQPRNNRPKMDGAFHG